MDHGSTFEPAHVSLAITLRLAVVGLLLWLGLSIGAVVFDYALGRHTTLTFISSREGRYQVYLLDTERLLVHPLVKQNIAPCCIAWSPNATQIAFARLPNPSAEPLLSIYTYGIDTDQIRLLAEDASSAWTAWSPDGKQLAYTSIIGDRTALRIIDVEGTHPPDATAQVIAPEGQIRSSFAWSPDGRQLLAAAQGEGANALVVMNLDGTGERTLTENDAGVFNPNWSPDGQHILYAAEQDGYVQIYVVDSAGHQQALTADQHHNVWSAWSADGRQVLYLSQLAEDRYAFQIINADGSDRRQIALVEGAVSQPAWSPDGRLVAFPLASQLYVMNVDGSGLRRLTQNAFTDLNPLWLPLTNPFGANLP